MTDYNFHLNQLPNFLIARVNATAGSLHGLSLDQIIGRYRAATEHEIAVNRSKHWPGFGYDDILFGNRSTKVQLDENRTWLSDMASYAGADINTTTVPNFLLAQNDYESILFLTTFNNYLISAQEQLNEAARQHAQRQAEEAARQLAQRQSEEAARQLAQRQVEEAARQLMQAQAEEAARRLAQLRAEEDARLLAQRHAEETARLLAQAQAAEVARMVAERESDLAELLLLRPGVEESAIQQIVEQAKVEAFMAFERVEANANIKDAAGNPVKLIPEAMVAEVDKFALVLEADIRDALAGFSWATSQDMGIPELDAFNAMLYAFKQTGLEVQIAY